MEWLNSLWEGVSDVASSAWEWVAGSDVATPTDLDMSSGDTSWLSAANSKPGVVNQAIDAVSNITWGDVGNVAKDIGKAAVQSAPAMFGGTVAATGAAAAASGAGASTRLVGTPPDPTSKYKRKQRDTFQQQQLQQNQMWSQTQNIINGRI